MPDQKSEQIKDYEVWETYKRDGNLDAKRKLIESYLQLVEYVVGRVAIGLPKNMSKDELISFGVMGLIDAIDKFDYDRGLKFETYASWRIRGAIIDGLRQGDWVPRSVRDKAKRLEEAYAKLEQQHLRSATEEEVMQELQLDERDFNQLLLDVSVTTVFSLNDPLKDDDSETRMSVLVDEKAKSPERRVHDMFLQQSLAKAIERLTEKERIVVSLFYYEELTLSEIAEVMSLTPSRISQLHSKAMLRLRGVLNHAKHQLMQD